MPVEKFGEALLRGMGWEKGKPVGRNPRGTVEAREYVRRPDRLGLGAQPKEILDKKKRKNRMDPSDRSNPHMVMIDEDGKVRHTKTLDEKLVEREKLGLYVGKRVAIMDGPHEGMSGKIVALEKRQSSMVARVKLELSGETIPVSSHLLGNISEVQAGRGLSGQEEEDSKVARATESILKQESHSGRSRRTSWLVPNIRVRIIDKRLAKGRYYLKKGHIVDVISPNSCDVVLDDGARHLSDVHQESLETVIPRVAGTPVRVLRGEHSRETAKLVSRDSSRGTVTVQLNTDYSLQTFRMDDVAEIQH